MADLERVAELETGERGSRVSDGGNGVAELASAEKHWVVPNES